MSAINCKVCENAEIGILESIPGRSGVRLCVSVTLNRFVPPEDNIWLRLFLQFPGGCSASADVRCKVAFVFGSDNN